MESTRVRLVVEGLLIVVSVALGLAVNEWRQVAAERGLARRVVTSIHAEMEHNLKLLEPMVPFHQQWVDALQKVDTSEGNQSGLDLAFSLRPPVPPGEVSPFIDLRRSAWEAAQQSGLLRLIDLNLAQALTDVYAVQERLRSNVDRLANGALSLTATYDPASRPASVRLLGVSIADIWATERILLDLYRQHLPAVSAAIAN